MVEVIEVKTKQDIKDFIEFPLKLYKKNPYYVPALYGEEKLLFTEKNIYNDQAEAAYFIAKQDGKVVGRIAAILQKASNLKWNQKRVRFSRFDCIDSEEVANALFDRVTKWAKERKMNELVGPMGFSDLEREGLLIEGFDKISTYETSYNYPYYQKLIENYGFNKDVDWVERRLRAPKEQSDRLERLGKIMMKKYNLHFGEAKNTNDFLNKYADAFFEILDKTYDQIYGTVPFTEAMKKSMIDNFRLIIDIKYVAVILDENDRVVCFGLCFPSIAKAVQKSGGRLTIPAIFRLLRAIKHPKVIDLGLIGVLPEYAQKGISSAIIGEVLRMLNSGIEYAETNPNLEDNVNIINQWKNFDAELVRRRRAFVKKIGD